jgi:hypothetical protein
MIIEYRQNDLKITNHSSRVLRTYKDVASVLQNENVTYLYGLTPAEIDTTNGAFSVTRYAQQFLIAAIHLDAGEYLEVVDVPRD